MTSGTSLLQLILDKFRNRLTEDVIESDMTLTDHQDEKKYYPVSRWEGKKLVIDITDTFTKKGLLRKRPKAIFGRQLALACMGWVNLLEGLDCYLVEPNLTNEFPTGIAPYADNVWNPQRDNLDPSFKFDEDGLRLSCFCNWRFTSLDQAHEYQSSSLVPVLERGSKYDHGKSSDGSVERSSIRSKRETFRTQTYPLSTLRSHVIDIIESQVAENTGKLVTSDSGVTKVTLHLKYG